MDLNAYIKINDLSGVAEANGIRIDRLRGYRLMCYEKPYSETEKQEAEQNARIFAYEHVLASEPPFTLNPRCYGWHDDISRHEKKYLITDRDGHTIGFRMELLHGKKRKALKYEVKRFLLIQQNQMALWNKYAGRDDVLYIHARLGSWNWSGVHWSSYNKELWFLDGCDDFYDASYCDIYARIDPKTVPDKAPIEIS